MSGTGVYGAYTAHGALATEVYLVPAMGVQTCFAEQLGLSSHDLGIVMVLTLPCIDVLSQR